MNIRQSFRRHIASAAAAVAVSAIFIGVTVTPVAVQSAAPVYTQTVA